MKKLIFTLFIIFLFPFYIFAYSNKIIPGGDSIGITINSDGIEIVGFYKVKDKYINKQFKVGDKIIGINDNNVSSISDLTNIIDNSNKELINTKIVRNNKVLNIEMNIIEDNNKYKTGLYIKDNIVGIGTLTYIDPESMVYGALGHEISFNESNNRVIVKDGNILESSIKSINKSRNGMVGSKNPIIDFKKIIGNVKENNINGLYGFYSNSIKDRELLEIGNFDEISKGDAYILTVTNSNKINKYKIEILDKYYSKKNTNKSFSFKITDNELLNKSGGIVQGMSGSPIIQNNKIIGAVTNVVIDNVVVGYGISIVTMLEEGDKIKN